MFVRNQAARQPPKWRRKHWKGIKFVQFCYYFTVNDGKLKYSSISLLREVIAHMLVLFYQQIKTNFTVDLPDCFSVSDNTQFY